MTGWTVRQEKAVCVYEVKKGTGGENQEEGERFPKISDPEIIAPKGATFIPAFNSLLFSHSPSHSPSLVPVQKESFPQQSPLVSLFLRTESSKNGAKEKERES